MFEALSRFWAMFAVWFSATESVGRSVENIAKTAEQQTEYMLQSATIENNTRLKALIDESGLVEDETKS